MINFCAELITFFVVFELTFKKKLKFKKFNRVNLKI